MGNGVSVPVPLVNGTLVLRKRGPRNSPVSALMTDRNRGNMHTVFTNPEEVRILFLSHSSKMSVALGTANGRGFNQCAAKSYVRVRRTGRRELVRGLAGAGVEPRECIEFCPRSIGHSYLRAKSGFDPFLDSPALDGGRRSWQRAQSQIGAGVAQYYRPTEQEKIIL